MFAGLCAFAQATWMVKVLYKEFKLALAIGIFAVLAGGCANQVAVSRSDEGTAIYRLGKYDAELMAPMDQVFPAANRALDSMGMLRTGEKVSDKEISVDARTVGDYKVRINMQPTKAGHTALSIKYGSGSLSQSQRIFWEIRRQLGAGEALQSRQAVKRIDYVYPSQP